VEYIQRIFVKMTIYKPNNPDKKQEKKLVNGPEIVIDDKQPLTEKAKGTNDVLLLVQRRPITNLEVLRRRRRIRCLIMLLSLVLLVVMAMTAALFVHKQLHRHRPYTGTCSVKYHEEYASGVGGGGAGVAAQRGEFSEGVEIDQYHGAYEKLEVPPVLDFRRSTVLHDFEMNLTAIVDRDHARCFILPLNRAAVKPPKNFLDLLDKFKSGYYLPNAEIVRESYKVVIPPIADLEPLGYYIWSDCQHFDTYHLVKDDQPIVKSKKKRSAGCMMLGDGFCLGDTFMEQMSCISLTRCSG
jgi:integral membrane protein 2B